MPDHTITCISPTTFAQINRLRSIASTNLGLNSNSTDDCTQEFDIPREERVLASNYQSITMNKFNDWILCLLGHRHTISSPTYRGADEFIHVWSKVSDR